MSKLNKQLLKARMVELGIRQTDLADNCKMDRSTLNRKINGKREFTLDEIQRLIAALDLSLEGAARIFFPNSLRGKVADMPLMEK